MSVILCLKVQFRATLTRGSHVSGTYVPMALLPWRPTIHTYVVLGFRPARTIQAQQFQAQVGLDLKPLTFKSKY